MTANGSVNGHLNGHANGRANGHSNGHANGHHDHSARPHPQLSCSQTIIEPSSFFGKLRALYADTVLKTQLEQLKKQGSYDAFKLGWHPVYDVRRLTNGVCRQDGIPPSLFWESDVGKWIEAVCYFLASEGHDCAHKAEFEASVQELVDMIEKAQQPDGYLNIYFTVVDKGGRFKNFRDLHEMYNAGHLLEAAIAHYFYTGSRQFLDVMIRNVACFAKALGPHEGQIHGYPGHPEFELAVLRLYAITKDQAHLEFGEYLLSERGVKRKEAGNEPFFVYEAKQRNDYVTASNMESIYDLPYSQSHEPLHEQTNIRGHSVRALYLTTAAADFGGEFLEDAKRLLADAVDHKMYATGGLGSEPKFEGFSPYKYRLPQSSAEGGCYAETCASIAAMMTSERILSWQLDGGVRETLELCLLNAVLGGGSLNGKQFSYANKHATCGDETAQRNDWFEVCCCPPNLSRTLGMLGGYTWTANVDAKSSEINLDIYLFVSAQRSIPLPNGETATARLETAMPWQGQATLTVSAPKGWKWNLNVPNPSYAQDYSVSLPSTSKLSGFESVKTDNEATVQISFSMPVHFLASHPLTAQDTLTVKRGPIVYTAESVDNESLEKAYPHFEGLGLKTTAQFTEAQMQVEGIPVVGLTVAADDVFAIEGLSKQPSYRPISPKNPARRWTPVQSELKLVPWFARANRGGAGHVRTSFLRAE